MAKYKIARTPFHHYETDNPFDKNYIRLTKTLLMNPNFLSLPISAMILYVYMKQWAYPKKQFNYPISVAKAIMSKNTFLNCIKKLEEKGFINIVYSNRYSHYMNVYEFSDRWYKK